MSLIATILTNLLSAFIGFMLSQVYSHLRREIVSKAIRWFWTPLKSENIIVYCGGFERTLTEIGELDPVVNLQDALSLAELRLFLKTYYQRVVISTEIDSIKYDYPVVSIGGPQPNSLTKEVGEQGLLPVWFRNMPYNKGSKRVMATLSGSETYTSEFKENSLVSDMGFIARINYPKTSKQFLYIIASNYGWGNWGVVKHIISSENLNQFRNLKKSQYFQAVIKTDIVNKNIVHTELVRLFDIK